MTDTDDFDNMTEGEKQIVGAYIVLAIWITIFRLIASLFTRKRKPRAVWVFPDGRTVDANLREAS